MKHFSILHPLREPHPHVSPFWGTAKVAMCFTWGNKHRGQPPPPMFHVKHFSQLHKNLALISPTRSHILTRNTQKI